MIRLPLVPPPETRDGTVEKDGLCKNLLVDVDEAQYAVIRPGLSLVETVAGNGNGVVEFENTLFNVRGTSLRELGVGEIATLGDHYYDFTQSVL